VRSRPASGQRRRRARECRQGWQGHVGHGNDAQAGPGGPPEPVARVLHGPGVRHEQSGRRVTVLRPVPPRWSRDVVDRGAVHVEGRVGLRQLPGGLGGCGAQGPGERVALSLRLGIEAGCMSGERCAVSRARCGAGAAAFRAAGRRRSRYTTNPPHPVAVAGAPGARAIVGARRQDNRGRPLRGPVRVVQRADRISGRHLSRPRTLAWASSATGRPGAYGGQLGRMGTAARRGLR
jgi:hypothetical protein